LTIKCSTWCHFLLADVNCVSYGLKGCMNLKNEKNNIKEERNYLANIKYPLIVNI
jgi:hypothetical protein